MRIGGQQAPKFLLNIANTVHLHMLRFLPGKSHPIRNLYLPCYVLHQLFALQGPHYAWSGVFRHNKVNHKNRFNVEFRGLRAQGPGALGILRRPDHIPSIPMSSNVPRGISLACFTHMQDNWFPPGKCPLPPRTENFRGRLRRDDRGSLISLLKRKCRLSELRIYWMDEWTFPLIDLKVVN